MNRQPSCGGRQREACSQPGVRSSIPRASRCRSARAWRATLLVCLGLGLAAAWPAGGGAAELQPPPKGAKLPLGAPPPLAECPAERTVCIRSEDRGEFDVRSGTADLTGNVRGYVRTQLLGFVSQRLKAQREGKQAWRRIELTGAVQLIQPGRRIVSNHAVIEPTVATAYGNVRLDDERRWGEGDELIVEKEPRRMTLKGTSAHPAMLFVAEAPEAAAARAKTAPKPGKPEEKAGAPKAGKPEEKGEAPVQTGTYVQAEKAVFDERSHQAFLTGAARVNIGARSLDVAAVSITVQFNEDNEVQAFQARGSVVITQPGRLLRGDSARTLNQMQTILVQGKARMQQEGQFDLTSERLEVFTDTQRGAVRSEDRQRPMSLFLNLKSEESWRLDATRMARLKEKEVPEEVTKKLEPIVGRSFGSEDAFKQAVKQRLTDEESERYMPLIVAQARP